MIGGQVRRPQRLLRPRSIRGRAVASAVAPLLVGSLVIAGASVGILGLSLPRSLDAALAARVADVAAELEEPGASAGDPPALGPVSPADPILVEVRTRSGRLLTASPGLPAGTRLCPDPLPPASMHDSPDLLIGDREVLLRRQVTVVTTGAVPAVVCAARRDDATRVLRTALFAVLALLVPTGVALVCLLLYRTVAGALRPVEQLTQQAARLSDLDAGRLPLPGTDDEIEDLAETLNAMLDRLHEQSRAGRRFVADAGHELRSPLATLRVALELAMQAPSDEVRPTLAVAIGDLHRLEELVQDLLVLATAQLAPGSAPRTVREEETVDLRLVAQDEAAILARRRPDLIVTVLPEVDGEAQEERLLLVKGREPAIARMLRNLLDNAARHAEREVDIELTAVLEGNHPQSMPTIIVQVRDDGPGFPPEHVDRVFEPFVRLDEARRRDDGGSGLGLSIVSATVRQMGGAVLAHPGPGGHVEVRLPANSRAARTERAACSDSAQLRPVSVEQRMSSWRGPA